MVNVRLGSKNYVQVPISKFHSLMKILHEPKKDEVKGNTKKVENTIEMVKEVIDAYNDLVSKKEKKPAQMSSYNNFIKQLKVPKGENTMEYGAKLWKSMSAEEKKKYK